MTITINELLQVASRLRWPEEDPKTGALRRLLTEAVGLREGAAARRAWAPTPGEDGAILPPPGFNPAAWRADAHEGWSQRYDVDCLHFGAFLRQGGCSCGSGNVHRCGLTGGEVTRRQCQKCAKNGAPQYARLIVAEGCPDCAEFKVLLEQQIGAAKVKSLLLNKLAGVRCLHFREEEGAKPSFDRETNVATVPSVRAELDAMHYPADSFAPLLLEKDGVLTRKPADIAARVAALLSVNTNQT